jgi:anthranilate synthase component 1
MNTIEFHPEFQAFESHFNTQKLVPVYAEFTADYETPLSAYEKIFDGEAGFLLESAELTQHSGRYSLLGSSPRSVFSAEGSTITILEKGKTRSYQAKQNAFAELRETMRPLQDMVPLKLPFFYGGAVGYIGYDAVRYFEPTLQEHPVDALGLPDMVMMICDLVLIFDHRTRKLTVVVSVHTEEHQNAAAAMEWVKVKVNEVLKKLNKPLQVNPLQAFDSFKGNDAVVNLKSNTTQDEYEKMVVKMKEYISAGDIFQGVPSQRFEKEYKGRPIDLFRALRHINPSPYMFCLQFPQGFSLVGSSPEVHVRCMNERIDIRPIAGTRKRGRTEDEDQALAEELLADPKERAEHIMLIDLARNDVGRVAQYGSVNVDELMIVERYSHVMHIVSNVTGQLAEGKDCYDVMAATFPAGTVSGSPKVRAMEIIGQLEKSKRGAYAGAVGYFGFDGNSDSCIALRTCVVKDQKVYVQAGAGVVADSDPHAEYQETVNKAAGMLRAVDWANQLAK